MLQHSGPWRERPESQKVLDRDLGYFARMTAAPDGTLATITAGLDFASELRIRNPDGSMRVRRSLTKFLPGRPYIITSPNAVSGLSFDAMGERLYVVLADIGIDGATAPQAAASSTLTTASCSASGSSPTRSAAASIRPAPATSSCAATPTPPTSGRWTSPPASSARSPTTTAASPSARPTWPPTAASSSPGSSATTSTCGSACPTAREQPLTRDGRFNYSPRWDGPDRVIALHEVDGRTQAVRIEVATGTKTVLSDAPFVVLDPVPLPGDRLAFVNREGWSWTLDWMDLGPGRVPPPSRPWPRRRHARLASRRSRCSPTTRTTRSTTCCIPTLRGPFVAFGKREVYNGSQNTVYAGVSLQGSDRLGSEQLRAEPRLRDRGPRPHVLHRLRQLPARPGVSGAGSLPLLRAGLARPGQRLLRPERRGLRAAGSAPRAPSGPPRSA